MQADNPDNAGESHDSGSQPPGSQSTVPQEAQGGGFRWQAVMVLMALVLVLLSLQLVRRFRIIDPVRRCADLYASSRTAVDTSLVDGIRVRVPEDGSHTTCAALRASGAVDRMPKRQLRTPQSR